MKNQLYLFCYINSSSLNLDVTLSSISSFAPISNSTHTMAANPFIAVKKSPFGISEHRITDITNHSLCEELHFSSSTSTTNEESINSE